ncbi:MAG: peptidylprolyl isomerase, partial [Rhodobacteraceae bacterium]|nr:peptidylprolyl isomerase [Paracoccaceae bacterium]
PKGKPGWAWQAAARAMVVRALLLQEAGRLGLSADPQMLAKDKLETDDEALIRAVLDTELDIAQVSEADCQRIYDQQPEVFKSPDLFQPAHILLAVKPEDKTARAIAHKNAVEFIATIQKTPKAFADIAKSNSDCPSKDAGGTLGQIGSGDTVPEFEAVLATLTAGDLHPEPVETRFGIHIIRMDEKVSGKPLPFDAVKHQIMEKLEQAAWAKAAQIYTQKLVGNAKVEGIDLTKPIGTIH